MASAHVPGSALPLLPLERTSVTLGFMMLSDCAPLVVALEEGYFEREGLDVTLQRTSSWANLRDRVSVGAVDGAHLLGPMPLAMSMGLGPIATPMHVAMTLDLNGDALTVSNALYARLQTADAEAMVERRTTGRALRAVIEANRAAGRPKLVFATVYAVSSHTYLLRYWLSAFGIGPEDLDLRVVPPPRMQEYLDAGFIDGYISGEPWGSRAVLAGAGRIILTSYDIWANHPEKVLAFTRSFTDANPGTVQAILRAVLQACHWLDKPENRAAAAGLISSRHYLNAPIAAVQAAFLGQIVAPHGQPAQSLPDFYVFHRYAANMPWRSHGEWFLQQMQRWGEVGADIDTAAIIDACYRPDLYRRAAASLGWPTPTHDSKAEGQNYAPYDVQTPTGPLRLGADRFVDPDDDMTRH